jgi:pimeloyl-ACP methyl ester carboxylesterase
METRLVTSILGARALSSTHGQPRPLTYEQKLLFMPAVAPPTGAMVFVHGYTGGAQSTWAEFNALLPFRQAAGEYDFFFYEYDGIQSELYSSIALTRRLLTAIAEKPALTAPALDAPRTAFGYQTLIVVGHSLGCVLARGALLELLELEKPWAGAVRLVLYAPAHVGARVDRLAASVYRGFAPLSGAASYGKFKSPLIEQLAEGSPQLLKLASDTVKAFERGHRNVIPRLIVAAEKEHVVLNGRFVEQDPFAEPIVGTYHDTVCKPRLDFLTPLDFLTEALS